jgi:hypothetical protein
MASASQIQHHMDVVGSDGQHVDTVDHMDGATSIKLTKDDLLANGQHHWIPLDWVSTVGGNVVRLNRTSQQARQEWRTSAPAGSGI